nr:hypothetical protein [Tanacetum cinerariifolium]
MPVVGNKMLQVIPTASEDNSTVESKTDRIEYLTNELEMLKKEKGDLDSKLTGFQTASKDLDNLLESQRSDKNKEGPSPAIESTSDDVQNRNPSVTEIEASPSTISSKPFIKFVKVADRPTEDKIDKVETAKKPTVKYAEQYRKPSKKSNGDKTGIMQEMEMMKAIRLFSRKMLLAMKDEARSNLINEENDFMLHTLYGEETIEELTIAVILMVRIQLADRMLRLYHHMMQRLLLRIARLTYKLRMQVMVEMLTRMQGDKTGIMQEMEMMKAIRLFSAIAAQPKMYNDDMLHSVNLKINSPDSEETLENAEESRLKMRYKFV